jgi:dTDP-4-amino-4,6-dideoxygalactose transaminase
MLVDDDFPMTRDALYEKLKLHGVFSRRYFYPLISSFPMYQHLPSATPENLPKATRAANQILCLPIYPDLKPEEQSRAVEIIRSCAQ